jgi:hypothetical protein
MKGLSSRSGRTPCPHAGMVFPHESEICDNGKCMICENGVFKDHRHRDAPQYGLFVSVAET